MGESGSDWPKFTGTRIPESKPNMPTIYHPSWPGTHNVSQELSALPPHPPPFPSEELPWPRPCLLPAVALGPTIPPRTPSGHLGKVLGSTLMSPSLNGRWQAGPLQEFQLVRVDQARRGERGEQHL